MSVIRIFSTTKNYLKNVENAVSSFTRYNSSSASSFIIKSDIPDVHIPNISVPEFIFSKAEKWPKLIAVECATTGRKYTYDQVRTKARNLGRSLRRKLKLQKGEVLAVLLPNCPEYIIAAVGALQAGLIVTTINPIYTPDEISKQLIDCSAKAVVTLTDLHPLAQKSTALTQTNIPILTVTTKQGESTPEGTFNFAEFLENVDVPDLPPANPEDIAFLPYSSGTTGLPKGVQLTHSNIVSNVCQFATEKIGVVYEATGDHQDVVPAVLPQFHIYGLVVNTLYCSFKGAKGVTLDKFAPELYVNTLKKHKPSVLFVAPPLVLFLTAFPGVTTEDLQCVRSVISGAAPLGGLDEDRFLKKAQKNIKMLQGYGLTETSPVVLMSTPDFRNLPASSGNLGRPIPNCSVKVVDPCNPTGPGLGPKQTGELLVKGPQVMKGYHNRPEQTKEAFADGWLRTGDIVYYTEDHLFFVTDRLKELIKVKGFQVPPAELEAVIRNHPDVEDAAVIGVPHQKYGEAPRAYIVQKPGKSIDMNDLQEYVKSKVAEYKQLRGGIEIVDAIPKNTTGKILRRTLKLKFEEEHKK